MDDPFLTKALGVIAKAKKPHTILNWMIQLSMQDSRVIESFYFKKMVEQLFLKKKSHKALGIFSSKRYFPASSDIRSEILQSLTKLIRMKTQKEIRTLCLFGLIAGSNQSDTILGGDEASVLSQYSISILSTLEEKNASTEFIPFFHSVLEAFSLSQRPAGDY